MEETDYREAIRDAMTLLGEDSRTLFLGQTVAYPGSRFTYGTLDKVPLRKRIELPIMEEAQLGLSMGLSLAGYIPVLIYPRVDFLLLGMNQLVNHLDKMEEMSRGQINPKVIIRATIGSTRPLHPGPQHSKDQTKVLETVLENVYVKKLFYPEEIVPEYRSALKRDGSSLLIDEGNLHFQNGTN